MGEVFDFIEVQIKSRKRSDYVIDRKSMTQSKTELRKWSEIKY